MKENICIDMPGSARKGIPTLIRLKDSKLKTTHDSCRKKLSPRRPANTRSRGTFASHRGWWIVELPENIFHTTFALRNGYTNTVCSVANEIADPSLHLNNLAFNDRHSAFIFPTAYFPSKQKGSGNTRPESWLQLVRTVKSASATDFERYR